MQNLPGFRDFHPGEYSARAYLFGVWRRVARTYGFVEYDAPVLESSELYEKKNSGGEILEQLYRFTDRGGRDVSLRPEMTPSLARMVIDRAPQLRKPLKWFSIAPFFRYERQQKGRLREFYQLNCDILGAEGPAADAELIALTIDILRALGFGAEDVVVRLSDRRPWLRFLEDRSIDASRAGEFLSVIDKWERDPPEVTERKLDAFGIPVDQVREFLASDGEGAFGPVLAELASRGMENFAKPDLSIVRGLAYYTGTVFEVFDRSKSMRAVAGGGRYDDLLGSLSNGKVQMPAIGMGMGDVVLGDLITSHPKASARQASAIATDPACEIFVVIADDSKRAEAMELVQTLREAGCKVDFPLAPAKVGKQFQSAEALGARHAVLVGAEWPVVKLKTMATREEEELPKDALAQRAKTAQL